jgi:hypothetical protein
VLAVTSNSPSTTLCGLGVVRLCTAATTLGCQQHCIMFLDVSISIINHSRFSYRAELFLTREDVRNVIDDAGAPAFPRRESPPAALIRLRSSWSAGRSPQQPRRAQEHRPLVAISLAGIVWGI